MEHPCLTVSRCPRRLVSPRLLCLALIGAVMIVRPARADTGSAQVLVGFKAPAYVLSRAVRAAILTRSRERARIASLRGQVRRRFTRADAMLASLPADAIESLRRDPSVAYVEADRPVHMLQLLSGSSSLPPAQQLVPEPPLVIPREEVARRSYVPPAFPTRSLP